ECGHEVPQEIPSAVQTVQFGCELTRTFLRFQGYNNPLETPIYHSGRPMAITQVFIYLQLLDLLTTLVGFKLGASEASPFIRMLMHAGPAAGVIGSKLVALALGGVCVYSKKLNLIRWVSYWYAALVVW